MHRANASVCIALGLLACASGGGHRAALGWSLGGEAHVFVVDDRFARDLYRELTGSAHLQDSLNERPLVALESRIVRGATVLSARGAAPARLTLTRFHAPQSCGATSVVTELVLAFPPGSGAGHTTPPSHVTVVALLDAPPFASSTRPQGAMLPRDRTLELVRRVAQRAQGRGTLLSTFTLDPDKAADAGEVIPVSKERYAVGFRARFLSGEDDTLLVTGVAVTDTGAHDLRWVMGPVRWRLTNGMVASGNRASRYSLRGVVAGEGNGRGSLLLVDEIADVAPRDSRAAAVDAGTGRVVAAQPLALRCP
ncbi:MAG TPA: hypothetical protein VG454_12255 [Gemmatimonadales bacterium]|nr:hypothetical protein [Gemmatimonadales bacterium]